MSDDIRSRLDRLPTFEEQVSQSPSGGHDPGTSEVRGVTVGDLARRLADAEVMDTRSIEAPGAAIVLPWGTELVGRLRQDVDRAFQARGFEPYEFPEIAPQSVYGPAMSAFPDVQQLLYAADAEGLASGTARGVLSPTGESMVYHLWARQVRSSRDLPLRLFRNARYFRPVPSGGGRAGRGVFHALEAPDVHEFHSALASEEMVEQELRACRAMVTEVVDSWHVPVVWSMRPPWTNNGELYRAAYGADTILPNGASLQVGVVYDQGTTFSREFDIRLRDRVPHEYALHITGCVTRRVLLAHVFQSHARSAFTLHPDVAPVQAVLRGDPSAMGPVAEALLAAGIRCRQIPGSARELSAIERRWSRRGTPAQLLVQAKRTPTDAVRIVLRDPGGHETDLTDSSTDIGQVVASVLSSLQGTGRGHDEDVARYRPRRCESADEASKIIEQGGVAVLGLDATREAVAALETRIPGEVLGLVPAADSVVCVESGRRVRSLAVVGRRA